MKWIAAAIVVSSLVIAGAIVYNGQNKKPTVVRNCEQTVFGPAC